MKGNLKLLFIFIFSFAVFNLNLDAGGFVILENNKKIRCGECPRMPFYTLEQKSQNVNIDIQNLRAITTVEQTFYNPNNRKMEGEFFFPVPKGAVLQKFLVWINGSEVEPELVDANKARKMYQDVVSKYMDPALLEYSTQDLYKIKIFPIDSNAKQIFKITYIEVLKKEGKLVEYNYPVNISKRHPVPIGSFDLKLNLRCDENIQTVYSPSYNLEVGRKGEKKALGGFHADNFKPKTDFKLYFTIGKEELGTNLFTYKYNNVEDGYFYMDITPALETEELEVIEKDITFVLDCSGSMSGEKMDQAKRAMLYCVRKLNENDRFNLVKFSTEAESLFKELQPFNAETKERAESYIGTLVARGGTNIDEALDLALDVEGDPQRPYMVVFITDGKPTIGVTQELPLLESVQRNIKKNNAKIFTFGIGDDLNAHLLDNITDLTNAYRTYISAEEDLELKLSSFYNKVSSPVLTDISISFNGVEVDRIYPYKLPDLYQGTSLQLFGRYNNWGEGKLLLEGKINDELRKFEFDVNFEKRSEKNDFIPQLWASRRIGFLLDQIRLNGESDEIKDEVVLLARKYGIITPYTSFLIIEDESEMEPPSEGDDPTANPSLPILFKGANQEALVKKIGKEYDKMKNEREGAASVQSSKEIMNMNAATSISEITPGQSRLSYTDKKGNNKSITDKVMLAQGRAFFKNGLFWEDIKLQEFDTNLNSKKVEFASSEYFLLMENEPGIESLLALGANIRFLFNGKMFEIYSVED